MVVGVTGGIGSGKTFVCNLFAEKGVPIYITDIEAKRIMNLNAEVKNEIINLFGSQAYINEVLNRTYISKLVFENKQLLNQLNAIVHPAVAQDFENWYIKNQKKLVIKESAILFETGAYKKCDATILVTAPMEVRIKRVMKRDNIAKDLVEKRINNQWNDEKKMQLADYIIENFDKQNTIKQVNKLFLKLIQSV